MASHFAIAFKCLGSLAPGGGGVLGSRCRRHPASARTGRGRLCSFNNSRDIAVVAVLDRVLCRDNSHVRMQYGDAREQVQEGRTIRRTERLKQTLLYPLHGSLHVRQEFSARLGEAKELDSFVKWAGRANNPSFRFDPLEHVSESRTIQRNKLRYPRRVDLWVKKDGHQRCILHRSKIVNRAFLRKEGGRDLLGAANKITRERVEIPDGIPLRLSCARRFLFHFGMYPSSGVYGQGKWLLQAAGGPMVIVRLSSASIATSIWLPGTTGPTPAGVPV